MSTVQADQLTIELLRTKHELQTALDQALNAAEVDLIERIDAEAKRLEDEADAAEASALSSESHHLLFAVTATIAAIAPAVTGLAPIVRQRWLWAAGVLIGVAAAGLLGIGVIRLIA